MNHLRGISGISLFFALLLLCGRLSGGGFFRVDRSENGRYFLVDPAGERFFAVGVDHVSFYVHRCAKRGGMPYHENMLAQFGSERAWAEAVARQLRQWGFNTVGIADKPGLMLEQGFAFPVFTAIGSAFALKSALKEPADWRNFPNVFDPEFAAGCLERARQMCTPWRGNPHVIGYFIDNELQWGGIDPENSDLFNDVMRLSPGNPAKVALRDFLHEKYSGNLEAFRKAWQIELDSWEAFLKLNSLPVPPECVPIRDAFLGEIADRYYRFTTAAIRAVDPDHLILGNRFAGTNIPDWVLRAAGKYCDVISVNVYPVIDLESGDLSKTAAEFERIFRLTGRPLYLTEWSFPALDSGLPSTVGGGMRVDTQHQRAEAARLLQTLVFSLPWFVGSNYFMWVDQSPYGRPGFPEDCNYGLIREDGSAYEELTGMFAELNPAATAIHAGTGRDFILEAVHREAGAVTCELHHFGILEQEAELHLQSESGVSRRLRAALIPGETTVVEEAFPGDEPVTVEILNSESVRGSRRMSAAAPGREWFENRSSEPFRGGVISAGGGRLREVPPLKAWEIRKVPAAEESAAMTSQFKLTEDGCGFSFSSDVLSAVSRGKKGGNLIDELHFGGHSSAGWVVPMLQWRENGENQWQAASGTGTVRVIREQPFVELEVVRCGGGGDDVKKPRWELTTRICFFAHSPEIWMRCAAIRNLGETPLEIAGFLLQAHPASAGARPGRFNVPNYYRAEQRNVWENPDGTRLGAWSPDGEMTVRFWRDGSGVFHPDARLAVEPHRTLAPGERWEFPEKNAYLVISDGGMRGGNPMIIGSEMNKE